MMNIIKRGRPMYDIKKEQLEVFDELGFSMTRTASVLGVSRQTIINRRHVFGLLNIREGYSDICDYDLDQVVMNKFSITPNIGERYVIGALHDRAITVQRQNKRFDITS